ncbi:glycoside hydrolase family 32 protein [Victivallis sp. Marseille-Q1083]|uniref:glycoside hydrolase family 32 protein n=1 Tax=Victivallis sp. Marseille-Q1083 TaxID=2717288 RepID=UPI00158C4FCD|nr:glycoside hydrolase family 32 protein [Victivallis sp. Marseille-Q1083]
MVTDWKKITGLLGLLLVGVLAGADDVPELRPCLHLTAENLPLGELTVWKAENGNARFSAPAGRGPAVAASAIGRKKGVVFAGGNWLEGMAVLPENTRNYTLAAVWQRHARSGSEVIVEQAAPGSGRRAALLTVGRRYGYNGENNDAHGLAEYQAGEPVVSVLRVTGDGRVALWHNGMPFYGGISAELMNLGAEQFRIGMRGSGAEGLHGAIGEILIFDRALDDREAEALSERLIRRWAIFDQPDLAVANGDFEDGGLEPWRPEGEAFRVVRGDALGTPAGQHGRYWVSSFGEKDGDAATGRLLSPPFRVEKGYLNFLIAGGRLPETLKLAVEVDGETVAAATGDDSELLRPAAFDLRPWLGKEARIVLEDRETGSWGHLNADCFRLTDEPLVMVDFRHELPIDRRYLLLPVSPAAEFARLQLQVDGERVAEFEAQLTDGREPCRYAVYDLANWRGKRLVITGDGLTPRQAGAVEALRIADAVPDEENDYALPYRNQFHFSVRRGWNNDPNGLVYNRGRWNLYYQYNPVFHGFNGQNWGYAHSDDLVHWREEGIVLPVRSLRDQAYSGGGFLDFNNTLGLNRDDRVAQVAAFTSTGRGESLAYSLDGGRSFTEIDGNPVLRQPGRDPRIFFHRPTGKWVMIVYNETDGVQPEARPDQQNRRNSNFSIFSSPDLRNWTLESRFTSPMRIATYECPDLYELPIEGKDGETRWVVSGVFNYYHIGRFDGRVFTPEVGPLQVEFGNVAASQSFSDNPDGRRIQIGWNQYQYGDPLVRFSQGFTLPHEMTLRETPEGLRLFSNPVRELKALRCGEPVRLDRPTLAAADRALRDVGGELLEIALRWRLAAGAELLLTVNGMEYPLTGTGSLRLYDDRAVAEIFYDDGAKVVVRNKPDALIGDTRCSLTAEGEVELLGLDIYRLKSIWPPRP